METAIELDANSWACFSPVEARRIMETFDIREAGWKNGRTRFSSLGLPRMSRRKRTQRSRRRMR